MKINLITYNGQPRHQLVGYLNGKTVRRWFDSHSQAEKFWAKACREAAQGAAQVATLPDADRASAVEAIRRAKAGGYNLFAALDHYESFLKSKPARSATVTEAVESFLKSKVERKLRTRSIESLRAVCDAFARHCGNRSVATISRDDVETFLRPDWSAQTKNGYLTRLSTFAEWCVKNDMLSSNPVAKVDRFRVEARDVAVLTPDDARRLLAACRETDAELLPYFALGLFCGIRPHELTKLTWSNVDKSGKHVSVGASSAKTRERRIVTVPDNCVAWLELGGTLGGVVNLRKRVEAIWESSGVTRSVDVMRHSFASYHLALNCDAPRTAHELGHKGDTRMLFTHYRNVVKPEHAKQYFEIRPS